MKPKNKHAKLKRRKEIRYHDVKIKTSTGKIKNYEHPAYIFLEQGNLYIYVVITHSSKVDDYIVVKLRTNPNPKDEKNSYYVADIRYDTKDTFTAERKKWKINELDDKDIRELFNKTKR